MISNRPQILVPKAYEFTDSATMKLGTRVNHTQQEAVLELLPQGTQNVFTKNQKISYATSFNTGVIGGQFIRRVDVDFEIPVKAISVPFVADRPAEEYLEDAGKIAMSLMYDNIGLAPTALENLFGETTTKFGGCTMTENAAETAPFKAMTMRKKHLALLTDGAEMDTFVTLSNEYTANPLRSSANAINVAETRGLGGNYDFSLDYDEAVQVTAPEAGPDGAGVFTAVVILTIKTQGVILTAPSQYFDGEPRAFITPGEFRFDQRLNDPVQALLSITRELHEKLDGDITCTRCNHAIVVSSAEPGPLIKFPAEGAQWLVPSIEVISQQERTLPVTTDEVVSVLLPLTGTDYVPSKYILAIEVGNHNELYESKWRFLPPQNIQVTAAGSSGNFASMTTKDLWKLSRDNGLVITYAQFAGLETEGGSGNIPTRGAGGFTMFSPADLRLGDNLMSNMDKKLTLSARVSFQRPSDLPAGTRVVVKLYQVQDKFLMWNSKLSGSSGAYTFDRLALSESSVLEEAKRDNFKFEKVNLASHSVMGGSWSSWLSGIGSTLYDAATSDTAKEVAKFMRNNLPWIREVMADGTMVGDIIGTTGYGGDPNILGGAKKKKVSKKGGGILSDAQVRAMALT